MSTQHELVVDLDKNSITLNSMYLGSNRNVEVRFDRSPWDGGSATITLHQVALTVIAGGHTHLAEALGAQKGSEES
nr:MAG TPA: hypothetical protein [Caudoviricetes sp.]